ncbi:Hpt domain-containing protein [Paracoccus aurantiacus]|uniref:Hpt domain-containing protein n=1 Tax=Paracoccus aurantiacus TaxID=2599412 RepID=A0A5C6RW58_9RHOB|nr:Hpt domain-containing protein [Paracoccus aurantiacus]TXB66453.1 Hpt domain-containing protein [Paracoccus aurantiacus]
MIDWKRVNELRAELGDDDFAPVVELFLDEIEGIVMRLTHGDAERLENDMHFLKGSAANLGFTAFAQICQQGEIGARDGHDAFDLATLLDCYAATKKEFSGWNGGRKSGAA